MKKQIVFKGFLAKSDRDIVFEFMDKDYNPITEEQSRMMIKHVNKEITGDDGFCHGLFPVDSSSSYGVRCGSKSYNYTLEAKEITCAKCKSLLDKQNN